MGWDDPYLEEPLKDDHLHLALLEAAKALQSGGWTHRCGVHHDGPRRGQQALAQPLLRSAFGGQGGVGPDLPHPDG